MAKVNANEVADYLLHFSSGCGDSLTNLKLQKLLYYAQGWHLALIDEPLFDEPIQAWVHGPAVRAVYNRFKGYGNNSIPCPSVEPALPDEVKAHLKDVLNAYGHLSAWQLERLTHEEEPWVNARAGLPDDQPSQAEISVDDMKRFFKHKLDEQEPR